MALDASIGGAASDSYVSLADANSYFDDRLWTDTWADADLGDKEKALKWATQILDRLIWVGSEVDDIQKLRWPRKWVLDLEGDEFEQDEIPTFLVQATCELAFVLLQSDKTADNSAEQLASLKVGPIDLKFNSEYEAGVFPNIVISIVSPYSYSFDYTGDFQEMKVGKA